MVTRIADALDAFGIVWYSVSPTAGVPAKMTDLAATACMLAAHRQARHGPGHAA